MYLYLSVITYYVSQEETSLIASSSKAVKEVQSSLTSDSFNRMSRKVFWHTPADEWDSYLLHVNRSGEPFYGEPLFGVS